MFIKLHCITSAYNNEKKKKLNYSTINKDNQKLLMKVYIQYWLFFIKKKKKLYTQLGI